MNVYLHTSYHIEFPNAKMRMKRHFNYNFGSLCVLLFRFTSTLHRKENA